MCVYECKSWERERDRETERERAREREARSLLSRQTWWFVTFSVSTIFLFFFLTEHYCSFFNGGWDQLCSIRRACVFVCTVFMFVVHAWERESEREKKQCREGSRGWGGLTVERQMGQRGGGWCSREQERERRKEKIWNRLDEKEGERPW